MAQQVLHRHGPLRSDQLQTIAMLLADRTSRSEGMNARDGSLSESRPSSISDIAAAETIGFVME